MLLFAILLVFSSPAACFNILGIFPLPAKSHYIVFDALMVGLARRGHNVTVYNTFPKNYTLPNYTEVNIEECFKFTENVFSIDEIYERTRGSISKLDTQPLLMPSEESILACKPLVDLRNSTRSFDILITESFVHDFFALFGYAMKIPVILMHSGYPFPWMSSRAALPDNPSYLPAYPSLSYPSEMGFFHRLKNTFLYCYALYFHKVNSENRYDKIAPAFFGQGVPSIEDAVKNASLFFFNTHYTMQRARPLVPNVVEIGGITIKARQPLPEDIGKFLNESTHGVVYFSMGSLLRGDTLPEEKRDAFLEAFAKLPQRVLWKWDDDILPGKSENIMISKWMPQRDILAHPNVKLFITHGGLLGLTEAVHEGVPILGVPIFSDQKSNLESIKSNGAGEILDYNEISTEAVFEKLSKLLSNRQYKKNAVELSVRFKDRPISALSSAIYWTEYVIRHRGAPHLKTAAVNMPWYQIFLLDVIVFLLFVILITLVLIYYGTKLTFKLIVKRKFDRKMKNF